MWIYVCLYDCLIYLFSISREQEEQRKKRKDTEEDGPDEDEVTFQPAIICKKESKMLRFQREKL